MCIHNIHIYIYTYIYIYIYIPAWQKRGREHWCCPDHITSSAAPLQQKCHGELAWEWSGAWRLHQSCCVHAKWTMRKRISLGVWTHCWAEDSFTKDFGAPFPEACFAWCASFRSKRFSCTFWASRWRQYFCYCTAAKVSCNISCVCFVVCWRWQNCHMGRSTLWWQ